MACSTIRLPLLQNHAVRRYAALAAAQSAPSACPEVQVLSNKVIAVAVDPENPITQVSVAFRVGSRNETYDTQGTLHHLRVAAGLASKRSSSFGITRNIQQLGGDLSVTTDRETIVYTLRVTRDKIDNALPFLEDATLGQVFKPWEVNDQLPRVRSEISRIPESARIIELLHKAAYRRGLGYSLYCPKRQVGNISNETLQHFVNKWFVGSRCAVVASGLPIGPVSEFAGNLNIPDTQTCFEPSAYYGGEIRKERNSPIATIAVAVESVGINKESEAIAFAVLQRAAGTGPRVKWGSSVSPLYRSVANIVGTEPFLVSAFNATYSDSGIFGFVLSTPSSVAGSATKAAYKWLRSSSISDADVARAKAELKADILYSLDSNTNLVETFAHAALMKGKVSAPTSIVASIDKVSASDVNSVLTKCKSGKISLAAIGDLTTVPYSDQLS